MSGLRYYIETLEKNVKKEVPESDTDEQQEN